jgi:alkanesulfonate monooxygenase SsuD/methylene tetrahydromethanopterin reductase-like flavin-dependent oxidoreductase (luciferase family)
MSEKIASYGTDKVIDFFLNLQVWGTPAQCYEKIVDVRRRVGNEHFVGVFSYAGMPWDDAEASLRLFARAVVPELQRLGPVAAVAPAPVRAGGLDVGLLGS